MKPAPLLAAALSAFLAPPVAAQTVFVDQGGDWNSQSRNAFYVQDQGARIMPIAWMRALTQSDGTPFLGGALDRYGYLPMPGREDASDLPVGFTTNGSGQDMAVGMTCAACHTRQIEVGGTPYRIDGGPAIVDFQSFLKDLDDAVLAVLADDASFSAFADKVLPGGDDPARNALKSQLISWSNRFHTLIDRSLPDPAWAPARLDAVSMIFNRLAGLDLGEESEDYLIPENIATADAPTRYPFLWNAAIQDYTQWPGFAKNGDELLGLARNLGEVYGVFGEFHPQKKSGLLFNRNYVQVNSANFTGLKALEDWIGDIGAPKWPWQDRIDPAQAAKGAEVFNLSTDLGGCVDCHGKKPGEFRSIFHGTWATPIITAGTDIRECQILGRTVKTGVLEGAKIPLLGDALGAEAAAFDVLANSVIAAIIQNAVPFTSAEVQQELVATDLTTQEEGLTVENSAAGDFLSQFDELRGAFPIQGEATQLAESSSACKYEARVLDGIWAAAPYLHNGSVPTLADLLKKPEDRPASFTPGPNYDLDAVGMARDQTAFDQVIETTGCDDLASGNSRCGHLWGTDLSDDQKRELLEYLKSI